MLTKRLLSAALGIAILFLILFSHEIIVSISIAIVIILALYEVYTPLGFIKKFPLALLGFALALCLVLGPIKDWNFILPLVCGYIMLTFILAIIYHKTVRFCDISMLLFITLYIALLMSHLRLLFIEQNGRVLIYTVFVGAWMTDSGAYFSGKLFGKHKLMPQISPKKTVEGFVGGFIFSIIGYLIFGFILQWLLHKNVNFMNLIILSIIAAAAAQVGDLAASMIKRELGIKDYGKIMPGHGGMLDRFDSVIFVAPVVYYYLLLIPIIVR